MPEWIRQSWPLILGIIDVVAATAVTLHAVLWKRDTRAVIGWVGLVWLAPIVGAVVYVCFGINRIERKAVALRFRRPAFGGTSTAPDGEPWPDREAFEAAFPGMRGLERLGTHVNQRRLLVGNRVEPLVNGDEAYPAMLAAIDGAEKSVALLSYIFDTDRAGQKFLEALVRAMDRGVAVRVLIDHVGASYSRPDMLRQLRRAGVPVGGFLPTRAPRLAQYANLRNHRKILVVDGCVGFVGGTNIREGHWLQLKPRYPVQCLHFRVDGPVVEHLREAFAIDWAFTVGEELQGPLWFPPLSRMGDVWARGVQDGPDEDFERVSDILLGALATATHSVQIVTPYFLPHVAHIHALTVAAMRGVAVDIILPSTNNLPIVHWAATATFWQLLEKGCRIHLTHPPFDHTKLMVVDRVWSLVGSTNWDPRSLRLNFEFNVECYDRALASQLSQIIEEKLVHSLPVTLEEVNSRSFPVRVRDGLSRLLTPYL
jgi:cardiolipin synthase